MYDLIPLYRQVLKVIYAHKNGLYEPVEPRKQAIVSH